MQKNDAIKKLERLINELDELPKYEYDGNHSSFDKWDRRFERYIEEVFGKESKYLNEYSHISYYPSALSYLDDNTHLYIKAHNKGREEAKTLIESFIEEVDEWKDEIVKSVAEEKITHNKSKVFIVHGHDDGLVAKVQLFFKKLGLEGIVLHEQANLGKVIFDKLEHYTDVGYAVVLYTPCDLGKAKNDEELNSRARQNVVFEHGYLIGKLGKERVAFLVDGKIETPGDMSGFIYTTTSNHWQFDIVKELKALGYAVSADNLF